MQLTQQLLESVSDVIDVAVNRTCRNFGYLNNDEGHRKVLSEAYWILVNAAEKYDSANLKFTTAKERNAGFRTYLDRCLAHIAYNLRRADRVREVPMSGSSDEDAPNIFEQEWVCSANDRGILDGMDFSRMSPDAQAVVDAILTGELDNAVKYADGTRYIPAATVSTAKALSALCKDRVEVVDGVSRVARKASDICESRVHKATREIREGIRRHCRQNLPSDKVFLAAIGAV